MPVTTYRSHGGRVRGQGSDEGPQTYLTDALGSVTALLGGDTKAVSYRYKPYGALLSRSGKGRDRRYLWTGDTGSRSTGLFGAEQHNRARHYGSGHATWTAVDPLWPSESAYGYAGGNPTTKRDPSGMKIKEGSLSICGKNNPCNMVATCGPGTSCRTKVKKCMAAQGFFFPNDQRFVDEALNNIMQGCSPTGKIGICLMIPGQSNRLDPQCNPCNSMPISTVGVTVVNDWGFPGARMCVPYGELGVNPSTIDSYCGWDRASRGCDCVVAACNTPYTTVQQFCSSVFYHEMTHCSGFAGDPSHNFAPSRSDFIFNMANCLCRISQANPDVDCESAEKRPFPFRPFMR